MNQNTSATTVSKNKLKAKIQNIVSCIFLIILVSFLIFWMFALTKSGKKNWEIEKSVMKPQLHEALDVDVTNSFFSLISSIKGNIQDIKGGVESFKSSFFQDYGVEIKKSKHLLNNGGRQKSS